VRILHERTNIRLSAADRRTLEAVVANRNSPQSTFGGRTHPWSSAASRAAVQALQPPAVCRPALRRSSGCPSIRRPRAEIPWPIVRAEQTACMGSWRNIWATACSSISAICRPMRTTPIGTGADRGGIRLKNRASLQTRVGIATGVVVVGDLTPMGVPPALPGRQQKFDISGGRHRRSMSRQAHEEGVR
jgi:hypothetical protein